LPNFAGMQVGKTDDRDGNQPQQEAGCPGMGGIWIKIPVWFILRLVWLQPGALALRFVLVNGASGPGDHCGNWNLPHSGFR